MSSLSRFQFIDIFRGCAVFFMIETHVVNALLLPPIKDGFAFKLLTFFNGFVAPSFLFCAGLSLAIMLHRKWDSFISVSSVFWKYIARLLFIFCVGYALHLPMFSFHGLLELNDDKILSSFYQADVLQVISLSLITLSLLTVVIRNSQKYYYVISSITLAIVFSSPIVREMSYEQLPHWLTPYLTMNVKSQFPLFPWSAFLISGTIIGSLFMKAKEKNIERQFIIRTSLVSVGGIIVSLLFEILPFEIYPDHNFWKASPEFFFMRLGFVNLFFCTWWLYEQKIETIFHNTLLTFQKTLSSIVSSMKVFGQESLLVYVVHLWIVYGSVLIHWSMILRYGKTLGYAECFALSLGLIIAMYFLAYGWHWIKNNYSKVSTSLQYALVTSVLIAFLVR